MPNSARIVPLHCFPVESSAPLDWLLTFNPLLKVVWQFTLTTPLREMPPSVICPPHPGLYFSISYTTIVITPVSVDNKFSLHKFRCFNRLISHCEEQKTPLWLVHQNAKPL